MIIGLYMVYDYLKVIVIYLFLPIKMLKFVKHFSIINSKLSIINTYLMKRYY